MIFKGRKRLHDALTKKIRKSKLDVYTEICREFHPVFRHFFTETFLNPVDWFQKRLNFTKSVACSSIVGYIVGLGDRHVQNILVDKLTADVVHIDLGIAFDQGKCLPVPETIPFRYFNFELTIFEVFCHNKYVHKD